MVYEISMPEDKGRRYEEFRYPAGEVQVRLLASELEKVAVAEEIRVTVRQMQGDIMPLTLLTDALREINNGNCHRWILILPYLPYGRADRRFVLGDSAGLKMFGRQIDELGYNLVLTLDAHSVVAKSCISNLVNVSPDEFISTCVGTVAKFHSSTTLILPDKGSSRYSLGKYGLPIVQCGKVRDSSSGMLSGFDVPKVKTEAALIIDDICDGGGTFLGIAEKLPETQLYLYVTHGIFSKGLLPLAEKFENVFTTGSVSDLQPSTFLYVYNPYWAFDNKIGEL